MLSGNLSDGHHNTASAGQASQKMLHYLRFEAKNTLFAYRLTCGDSRFDTIFDAESGQSLRQLLREQLRQAVNAYSAEKRRVRNTPATPMRHAA